jgi:hypothetical protein
LIILLCPLYALFFCFVVQREQAALKPVIHYQQPARTGSNFLVVRGHWFRQDGIQLRNKYNRWLLVVFNNNTTTGVSIILRY